MPDLDTRGTAAVEARIVGNLAGVVEWANDAFARLSGMALDETLNKPIGRLLERAGIDLEIVEFVAQHFFEGRVCRVAFPFERPDGRRIDILLEVEALRDAVGEIDRFVAIAREEPGPAQAQSASATTARSPESESATPAMPSAVAPIREIDLNSAVRRSVDASLGARVAEPTAARIERDVTLEVDLDAELGPVAVVSTDDSRDASAVAGAGAGAGGHEASAALDSLVTALFEAACLAVAEAGNAGSVITLSTARLPAHRRFVSQVHVIAACPPERSGAGDVVLEVHDTGLALPPSLVASLARGDFEASRTDDASARVRALAGACALARALGARVHLDSTPGCGNQTLVLFSPAPASTPARPTLPTLPTPTPDPVRVRRASPTSAQAR